MEKNITPAFSLYSLTDFTEVLGSKAAVPGGGGASALVGAVGTALGNMVANLTIGKKKYADVQDEMAALKVKGEKLQKALLSLIDEDAKVFLPLSKAYAMPSATDAEKAAKTAVMETALEACCQVPVRIMECCGQAIELQKEFAEKGSALAVSDAGVGAICCKSAMQGAALNVYINTAAMQNREKAKKYNQITDALLQKYTVLADAVYAFVASKLRGSE